MIQGLKVSENKISKPIKQIKEESKRLKTERAKQLKALHYGELQRTEEYKDYIERFVYNKSHNMSSEVKFILNSGEDDRESLFTYDDIENLYLSDEQIKEYHTHIKTNEDIEEFRDSGEDRQEIYQWFLMDDRLIYQLRERGEPILNDCYWGRTCYGQAIEMDGVIVQIFKEWYLENIFPHTFFKEVSK